MLAKIWNFFRMKTKVQPSDFAKTMNSANNANENIKIRLIGLKLSPVYAGKLDSTAMMACANELLTNDAAFILHKIPLSQMTLLQEDRMKCLIVIMRR